MKPGQSTPAPIGHAWLGAHFAPATIAPYTESYVDAGARRIEMRGALTAQFYPRIYATGDDIAANLRFALSYEPLDLAILVAAFQAMPPETITDWVRAEPIGPYARVHGSSSNTSPVGLSTSLTAGPPC